MYAPLMSVAADGGNGESPERDFVRVADLATSVRRSKTASTAKGYLAVLGQLEEYFGGELRPGDVTADFVNGFGRFLIDKGLSAPTVAMYRRTLRALLRQAFGKEAWGNGLKAAFAAVESANVAAAEGITAAELRRVAYADLTAFPWLMRVRDLFMVAVYGCGLTLNALKTLLAGGVGSIAEPFGDYAARQWIDEAAAAFECAHGIALADYVDRLSDANYSRGLEGIATVLELRHALTEKSAVDGWIAIARELNVGAGAIVGAAATETDYHKILAGGRSDAVTERDIHDAAISVASAITDLTERWYVMRCFAGSPEAIATELGEVLHRSVTTFVPEIPQSSHPGSTGGRLMEKLLFVRCRAAEAVEIRKIMGSAVHLFSFRDSARTPAFISTSEMMAFMFLNDVATDTITYYFPDEAATMPEFAMSERVKVTNGNLTGQVGVIDRIGRDRLRVGVRIEALNGAVVTAEVPVSFLAPV